jgi:two-component system nitrate/nitrite response regulator NarP
MVFPFMNIDAPSNDALDSLTPRERDLLSYLSDGRTNAQIATELGISLNTVKFHLKNLYEKLSVNNRAQAVARYLADGDNQR